MIVEKRDLSGNNGSGVEGKWGRGRPNMGWMEGVKSALRNRIEGLCGQFPVFGKHPVFGEFTLLTFFST